MALLAYRLMAGLSIDALFFINAGCQFLLILLGVIVAVKATWPAQHPWRVLGAFILIGALGMFAAIRQQQQASKENAESQKQLAEANTKLAISLDRLGSQANEISRVQNLNTELQERLLETTKDTASEITGADSFCVFLADFSQPPSRMGADAGAYDTYSIDVTVHGKYPMSNVRAEYRWLDDPEHPDWTYGLAESNTTLYPGTVRGIGSMGLGRHEITVHSRNGKLTQTLVLGNTNGKLWQRASIVRDSKNVFSLDSRRKR